MDESLYSRLGGSEGIHAICANAIGRHYDNPIVAPRFAGSDRDKLVRLAHEFFCIGTGGSECYTGREMREAHASMNISEREFVAVLDDILAALADHGVGQREQEEVLFALYALKPDIVHV